MNPATSRHGIDYACSVTRYRQAKPATLADRCVTLTLAGAVLVVAVILILEKFA